MASAPAARSDAGPIGNGTFPPMTKMDEFRFFRKARIASPLLLIAVWAAGYFEMPLLFFVSIITFIFSVLVLALWECPRCRRFFCTKFGFPSLHMPFVNKCVHCGYDMNRGKTA